jgi:hypothetical protein
MKGRKKKLGDKGKWREAEEIIKGLRAEGRCSLKCNLSEFLVALQSYCSSYEISETTEHEIKSY